MAWQDIDLFQLEASSFSLELYQVIVPLFEQGHAMLKAWEDERRASLQGMLDEAKGDDDEERFARGVADEEEWRNFQRSQVLGATGLHYLYSAFKDGLKNLCRYFDKSHARVPGGYKGKHQLEQLREEFLQRFGVDWRNLPHFDSIEELALARNAGIHMGADTLKEYISKIERPRFCKGGEFAVERQSYMEILDEIERFFASVVQELIPIRNLGEGIGKRPDA